VSPDKNSGTHRQSEGVRSWRKIAVTLIDATSAITIGLVKTSLIALTLAFATFPCSAQVSPTKVDQKVAILIGNMLNKRTEHRAFADLEALGCAAVPAIIKRMDDRRTLPDPTIALVNKSPDAFEGLRHYGPKKVVDALAAILNQLTGEDFGSIYNGATDEERTRAVNRWRDWLSKTPPQKLCGGG
jgi:hypothetical protein